MLARFGPSVSWLLSRAFRVEKNPDPAPTPVMRLFLQTKNPTIKTHQTTGTMSAVVGKWLLLGGEELGDDEEPV